VELAEPYRQTILLRYFEGLPVEDVARRMDVPLDTTRSRISRGLAKLRERLSREFGTDDNLALALLPLFRGRGEPAAAGTAAAGGHARGAEARRAAGDRGRPPRESACDDRLEREAGAGSLRRTRREDGRPDLRRGRGRGPAGQGRGHRAAEARRRELQAGARS